MKKYLLVLGLTLAACAPKNKADIPETYIEKNRTAALSVDDLFERYEIVHLLMTDSSAVGIPRTIRIQNDVIYVSDGSRLFRFSRSGAPLGVLDRRGNGPQEYYDIMDFTLSGEEVFIVDRNRKFLRYTTDFVFKDAAQLEFIPGSLHALDSSRLIFTTAYQQMTAKFHLYDPGSMSEVARMGEVSEAELTFRHFMNQDNYFLFENRLLFHEPMNNRILQIEDNRITTYSSFDLYGKNPPPAFWEKSYNNVRDIAEQAQQAGYCYGLPVYAEGNRLMIFTFRDGAEYLMNRTDKNTERSAQSGSIVFSEAIGPLSVADLTINADTPNSVVIAMPNAAFFSEQGTALDPLYSDIVEDGNPVVLIGEMK